MSLRMCGTKAENKVNNKKWMNDEMSDLQLARWARRLTVWLKVNGEASQ